jgi:hypothetical protein
MRNDVNRVLKIFGILFGLAIIAALALVGFMLLSNLNAPPPGVGPEAEQGYQACAPIITALEQHHAQTGAYPATLEALVPAFLPKFEYTVGEVNIDYRPTDKSYRLEFRYTGPGMNICTFTPDASWKCTGYF